MRFRIQQLFFAIFLTIYLLLLDLFSLRYLAFNNDSHLIVPILLSLRTIASLVNPHIGAYYVARMLPPRKFIWFYSIFPYFILSLGLIATCSFASDQYVHLSLILSITLLGDLLLAFYKVDIKLLPASLCLVLYGSSLFFEAIYPFSIMTLVTHLSAFIFSISTLYNRISPYSVMRLQLMTPKSYKYSFIIAYNIGSKMLPDFLQYTALFFMGSGAFGLSRAVCRIYGFMILPYDQIRAMKSASTPVGSKISLFPLVKLYSVILVTALVVIAYMPFPPRLLSQLNIPHEITSYLRPFLALISLLACLLATLGKDFYMYKAILPTAIPMLINISTGILFAMLSYMILLSMPTFQSTFYPFYIYLTITFLFLQDASEYILYLYAYKKFVLTSGHV